MKISKLIYSYRRLSTSSSIQERTYRAYSGEDTVAITLLEGVPGVRTTLRGQEDSLRSRVSLTDWDRVLTMAAALGAMVLVAVTMSPMQIGSGILVVVLMLVVVGMLVVVVVLAAGLAMEMWRR